MLARMNFSSLALFMAVCMGSSGVLCAVEAPLLAYDSETNLLGLTTNGPAVLKVFRHEKVTVIENPDYVRRQRLLQSSNRVPEAIRKRMIETPPAQTVTNVYPITNFVFQSYLPGSLSHLVWTNCIAWTNGRTMAMWAERQHPAGWPGKQPRVKRNPRSLIYGLRGYTGLSPCWEGEGSCGQAPVTALTRRHGYTRGHGMGRTGFRTDLEGKRVWFLAEDNDVVQVRIAREVVRAERGRDYTIVLFDKDLPTSISPLRVANAAEVLRRYPSIYYAPFPMFLPEQVGNVSAGLPGLTYSIYKGGDSGSPNFLPLPGELIFMGGRSTSSPDPNMQADMDELCRMERLNPEQYRMQWMDLTGYPQYNVEVNKSLSQE